MEPNDLTEILNKQAGLEIKAQPIAIQHGKSGNSVWHYENESLFVKVTDCSDTYRMEEVVAELAVNKWLYGQITVPDILYSGSYENNHISVMTALKGVPVSHVDMAQAESALRAVVHVLSKLHSLNIVNSDFNQTTARKLFNAAKRLEAGYVNENDFDDERLGMDPRVLLRELTDENEMQSFEPVFTHGDACLPNFIWDADTNSVGMIDLGRAGVGDRYQDIALFLRSAVHNFPLIDTESILENTYPLRSLDQKKIEYFKKLDEFF